MFGTKHQNCKYNCLLKNGEYDVLEFSGLGQGLTEKASFFFGTASRSDVEDNNFPVALDYFNKVIEKLEIKYAGRENDHVTGRDKLMY